MKLAVLYRTHPISIDSLPSVPRIMALLLQELLLINPDLNIYIGCPEGGDIQGIFTFDIGKSYTQSKLFRLKRKIYHKLSLGTLSGPANRSKVKKFFRTIPTPDIILCAKMTDIFLARKYSPKSKIIWWHLGLDKFSHKEFSKAIYSSDLIVYTGSVTYQYVFDSIMPEPFAPPVLIAHGPYPFEEMKRILNSVTKNQARQDLGIPDEEIALLHIGGNREEKGYKVLELALKLLPQTHNKLHFLSIGHAKDSDEILPNGVLVKKRGFFSIKELYRYYIAADIGLVAPLWKEPGPAVFIEMLFFNTAVIAAYNAGIPEMMGSSDCAIPIHEPNNVLLWAEQVSKLVDNENLQNEYARKGHERATEFFQEPVIENWTKAINGLGSNPKGSNTE